MMRTCRLFHEIAAPLLYTHVVTDSLSDLLLGTDEAPKRRHLQLTRTLKIEYREKGKYSPEPTYHDICRVGRQPTWQRVAPSQKEQHEATMQECSAETEELGKAVTLASRVGMRRMFSKLETLAVGSIYGRDAEHLWSQYEDWHIERETESATHDCGRIFYDTLLRYDGLRHLCIRDPSGPLNIPTITYASDKSQPTAPFSQIIHFDFATRLDQLASPLGTPMSWVSDCSPDTDLALIFRRVYENLMELCMVRDSHKAHGARFRDTADITIYGSTNQITPRIVYHHIGPVNLGPCVAGYGPEALRRQVLTSQEKRVTLKAMAAVLQAEYRKNSGVKDIIRWLPSEDAPRCDACGSRPPGCE